MYTCRIQTQHDKTHFAPFNKGDKDREVSEIPPDKNGCLENHRLTILQLLWAAEDTSQVILLLTVMLLQSHEKKWIQVYTSSTNRTKKFISSSMEGFKHYVQQESHHPIVPLQQPQVSCIWQSALNTRNSSTEYWTYIMQANQKITNILNFNTFELGNTDLK